MAADARALGDLDPFDLLDIESARVDLFLSWLPAEAWSAPTRCSGWTLRDLLAHLASLEEYHRACLDDTVGALVSRAYQAGVEDMDAFNAWGIRLRAVESTEALLERWRDDNRTYRIRARQRGREGQVNTAAGAYPAGLQAFYLASEYATHADDMDAPVGSDEELPRTEWRARFTRYVLEEYGRPVRVYARDGRNLVQGDGSEVVLTDAQLVAAGVGRLSRHMAPHGILAALACLA